MLSISRFCPWAFPNFSLSDRSSVASGHRNASNGSLYNGSWNLNITDKHPNSKKGPLKLSKAELSLSAKIRAFRRSILNSKENINSNEKGKYYYAPDSHSARPDNKRPYTESLASTHDEAAGTPKRFKEIEDVVMSMFPDEESVPSERLMDDPSIEDSTIVIRRWLQNVPNRTSYSTAATRTRIHHSQAHPRLRAPRPAKDVTMLDPEIVSLGTPTASLPKALKQHRFPLIAEASLKRSAPLSVQESPRKRRKLEPKPAIISFEWYELPQVKLIREEHQKFRMVNKHAAIVPSLSNPLRGATHPVVWSCVVAKRMEELTIDKRLRRHRPQHYLSLLCPLPKGVKDKGDRIISAYQKIIRVAPAPESMDVKMVDSDSPTEG